MNRRTKTRHWTWKTIESRAKGRLVISFGFILGEARVFVVVLRRGKLPRSLPGSGFALGD